MQRNGIGGLLLAGLAAFGYYKYSKMTEEQKRALREKGKNFVNKNFGDLGNMFGKKPTGTTAQNPVNQNGY